MDTDPPLVIVDAANVVGSVPDGWWRAGVPGPAELVLVVEGAARGVASVPGVPVVAAPGSGDDAIVDLVREASRACLVVTADRALRERVTGLGAEVVGPRVVRS